MAILLLFPKSVKVTQLSLLLFLLYNFFHELLRVGRLDRILRFKLIRKLTNDFGFLEFVVVGVFLQELFDQPFILLSQGYVFSLAHFSLKVDDELFHEVVSLVAYKLLS